jgi:hypothetical protein
LLSVFLNDNLLFHKNYTPGKDIPHKREFSKAETKFPFSVCTSKLAKRTGL